MIRIVSFALLVALASVGPWLIFAVAAVVYAFYFTGIELIFLAIFVDAFFMSTAGFTPYYTLAAVGILCAAELVKPYTVFYNQ